MKSIVDETHLCLANLAVKSSTVADLDSKILDVYPFSYQVSSFSYRTVECPWEILDLPLVITDNNSQCYLLHRHLNNASCNYAHSLIGKPNLAIIANNESRSKMYQRFYPHLLYFSFMFYPIFSAL